MRLRRNDCANAPCQYALQRAPLGCQTPSPAPNQSREPSRAKRLHRGRRTAHNGKIGGRRASDQKASELLKRTREPCLLRSYTRSQKPSFHRAPFYELGCNIRSLRAVRWAFDFSPQCYLRSPLASPPMARSMRL